jgi:hypothetical protein
MTNEHTMLVWEYDDGRFYASDELGSYRCDNVFEAKNFINIGESCAIGDYLGTDEPGSFQKYLVKIKAIKVKKL